MDASRRTLERAAAQGDPQAAAALLRSRLRAGELSRERVALAAYLGDEASRVLVPDRAACLTGGAEAWYSDFVLLGDWIRGLASYGQQAMLRAAVAAAARTVRELGCEWPRCEGRPCTPEVAVCPELRAINAAEAWCELPTDGRLEAWLSTNHAPTWPSTTPSASATRTGAPVPWVPAEAAIQETGAAIQAAAEVIGEPATREAVAEALIPWALA